MSAVLNFEPPAPIAQAARQRALRFLTAGSVDDGKSTLIGRLLVDSRAILADQLAALERQAAGRAIDLSLLTDGLQAEREQGITIDVAYRYFATPRRKFIIADAPGHEQYTRNMVTAAAGSDAAVVLIDATKLDWRAPDPGLRPQSRRHALLAQLLRVPGIVFAVNKLDAVDDPAAAFAAARRAIETFAAAAGIGAPAAVVPISALRGDNVTRRTPAAWYRGPCLLELLEGLPSVQDAAAADLMLPVQYVTRDDDEGTGHQPRVAWGRIAQGEVRVGDAVQLFPSGQQAKVAELRQLGRGVDAAMAGQSTGIAFDRQLDVSRGDWIAVPGALHPRSRFEATIAWLDTEPAVAGRRYWLRHGHAWVMGRIAEIHHRLDVRTLAELPASELAVNDIGRVTVELQQPLPIQPYADNRVTGALIVVDPTTNRTSGALLAAGPG